MVVCGEAVDGVCVGRWRVWRLCCGRHLSDLPPPPPPKVRLSAAIYFKNLLMRCWAPDNEDDECLGDTDREAVKKHLVQLMLSSPKPVQAQLSQALAIVSKEDFPAKWYSPPSPPLIL